MSAGSRYLCVLKLPENFFSEVYDVVRQIPEGKVSTYGMVARLVGFPNHFRLVARAPNWPDQQLLLEAEGVRFCRPGYVHLESARWNLLE